MAYIFYYLGTTLVGTIVWAIRLEAKVNTQERLQTQKHQDLKELINVRFDAIGNRLDRIEKALNGHFGA